jgi:hypothetical protein
MSALTSTDDIEAQVDRQSVEFVRAGYAGASLHFRVECPNRATFRECAWAIEGYNNYDPATVVAALDEILGQCDGVEIGREYSPVIYVTIPFWTHQAMAAAETAQATRTMNPTGEPIPEGKREELAARVMLAGKLAHADEYKVTIAPGMGKVHLVRLWWD